MFRVGVVCLVLGACGLPPRQAVEPGSTRRLGLNDVSFLIPLPMVNREASLLSVSATGVGGSLLPAELSKGLPTLVERHDPGALYDELRVVSARVDPCFPSAAVEPACVRQVRLVAQPVITVDGGITTRDATVHLFYSLDERAFARTVARVLELDTLAGAATDGPLDVHPVMRRQGLDGPYHGKLQALILGECGAKTLTRIAFMSVDEDSRAWQFGAFNVVDGALVDDTIPRLPMLKVQAFQELGSETFRNGSLVPAAPNDPLDTLLSERSMRLADRRTLDKALTSALRIEHPARSSPKTVDCASCHVASRARANAERFHGLDSSEHADAFTSSSFELQRVDAVKDEPRALRAFGYFQNQSAFSQRTINESAVVAEALNGP